MSDYKYNVNKIEEFNSKVQETFAGYVIKKALSTPRGEEKDGDQADDVKHYVGDYKLGDLLTDLNGSDGFTEDKAALGTVPTSYYLQLPSNVKDFADFHLGRDPLPKKSDAADFLISNYEKLTEGNVREQTAVFSTLLRYEMVKHGFIATNLENRSVYVDEYNYIGNFNSKDKKFPATREMVKFIADYWENIVSVVAHVFRVRGHHWKPEYADLYDRTWRCTTITVPERVTMPTWEEISRTALHCFGVKALHLVRENAFANGRLSNGLKLRRSAACAGSAPVRTAKAVVDVMSRAKWFPAFATKFQEDLTALFQHAEQLALAGTAAHINAKLYSWESIKVPADLTQVTKLAPYFMGFLSTLDQKEDITKQASLTKKASGGALIARDFANVIIAENRRDSSQQTVTEYLKNA